MCKNKIVFFIVIMFLLTSCGEGWESVKRGLTGQKKLSTDEFLVKKKDPLILPPDFESLPTPTDSQDDLEEISSFKEKLTKKSLTESTSSTTSSLKETIKSTTESTSSTTSSLEETIKSSTESTSSSTGSLEENILKKIPKESSAQKTTPSAADSAEQSILKKIKNK